MNRSVELTLHLPATMRANADHIDYLSVQALLFRRTTVGFVGQIKLFFSHTKRVD